MTIKGDDLKSPYTVDNRPRLRDWDLPYSENWGVPTDEERGIWCPEGIKIAELNIDNASFTMIEPWDPEHAAWCTPERFDEELRRATEEAEEAQQSMYDEWSRDQQDGWRA
jgi:hypothetical protein